MSSWADKFCMVWSTREKMYSPKDDGQIKQYTVIIVLSTLSYVSILVCNLQCNLFPGKKK